MAQISQLFDASETSKHTVVYWPFFDTWNSLQLLDVLGKKIFDAMNSKHFEKAKNSNLIRLANLRLAKLNKSLQKLKSSN